MNPSLLDFEWSLPPGVHAAFTTRIGGVSTPPWDSFNLAAHVGDDPAHVEANRMRLMELLALPDSPFWLEQVHGTDVLNPAAQSGRCVGDASITDTVGKVCVVMVADCLPVLFATRDGGRVGAAHAGWRGLAAGVLERTVSALAAPAHELKAWLGPAISREHFEVGPEVHAAFLATDAGAADCFEANARGRWQADLAGLARRRLAALGVTDVSGGEWCTFADGKRFFSHRRDGKGGRMAALIWKS
jgi:YfiH family protein